MPVYYVLEQEKAPPTATQHSTATRQFPAHEDIPVDEDAPPIPEFNPGSDNAPAVENPTTTNSSPVDVMYAEVGTRSAAKT